MKSIKEDKFINSLSDFLGILFVTVFSVSSYAYFKIDNILFDLAYIIMLVYFFFSGIFVTYCLSMIDTYKKDKKEFIINSVLRNSKLEFKFFFYYGLLLVGFIMPFFFDGILEKIIAVSLIINFGYQAFLHIDIMKKFKLDIKGLE